MAAGESELRASQPGTGALSRAGMNTPGAENGWMSSGEARRRLRVSACHLMHLRNGGRLRFRKQGNAFLYAAEDVDHVQREQDASAAPAAGRVH